MTESASGKKSLSMTLLALGVVMLLAALYFINLPADQVQEAVQGAAGALGDAVEKS